MIKKIISTPFFILLYRRIQRIKRFCLDQKYRQNLFEINKDLKDTRAALRTWGRKGIKRASTDHYFAILSFTRVPFYAKCHALIAKIAQLGGYTPLIINKSGNKFVNPYYHLMGVDHVLYWDQFVGERLNNEELNAIVSKITPENITPEKLMDLNYKNVEIGKHALSMVCRQRLEGKLDFGLKEVKQNLIHYLRVGVESVMATEHLLKEYPIKKMLVRDSGYTPNGGIFETSLTNGVDCIVHDFGQLKGSWVFKRHTLQNRNEHFFSLSEASWEALKVREWTNDHETDLQQEFAERYQSNSLKDTRRLQHGKQMKTPEEVIDQLGLDPEKKTAVIFSHIAWDAAFFYGTCLFGDFENWLFQTVKFVSQECPEMNWIVKLHPFNALKLQREDKDEESEMRLLRSIMPLPEHVVVMRADTDINTHSLFPVIDYVLTVNGTVGMEFPCFGIPALLGGTGRYDHRGFTLDPESREEYFQALRNLHKVPKLTKDMVRLAKKHYLALMRGRQTLLETVAPMELRKFNEAQSELHNNITFTPRTLQEFESDPDIQRLSDWLLKSRSYDILNPGFRINEEGIESNNVDQVTQS